MVLETSNKRINLVLRTRKIVDIARILKSKNFEECFFKTVNEKDLDALSKIIFILAEDENGKNPFSTSDEIYDFLDEYKIEKQKTYDNIFNELAEEINKEGFFNKKMTDKQLKNMISNPLSQINIDSITQKAVEKAIASITEAEIITSAN